MSKDRKRCPYCGGMYEPGHFDRHKRGIQHRQTLKRPKSTRFNPR